MPTAHHRSPATRPTRGFALLLTLLALLAGCDGWAPQSTATDGEDELQSPDQPASPTIISLTPAVTQMLIDMGKRDHIVGVSKDDDPSLGLPVCGSFNQPVIAQIRKLEPDLVITETASGDSSGVPQRLRSLSEAVAREQRALSLSTRSAPPARRPRR